MQTGFISSFFFLQFDDVAQLEKTFHVLSVRVTDLCHGGYYSERFVAL